jgi:hypothetical protein
MNRWSMIPNHRPFFVGNQPQLIGLLVVQQAAILMPEHVRYRLARKMCRDSASDEMSYREIDRKLGNLDPVLSQPDRRDTLK